MPIRSRRLTMAAMLGALAVAALGVGCGDEDADEESSGSGQFAGRTLRIASPGGALTAAERAAYYVPFEEDTGAKIETVETDYGALASLLKSQAQAGRSEFDLASSIDPVTKNTLADQGVLEKIDTGSIEGIDSLDDQYFDDYGVATEVDAVVPAYSADAKAVPDTAAFFDPEKYPGDRAVAGPDSQNGGIMCLLALSADGVPPEDLAPIDIDRCLSIWDRVKPSISVWWASGTEMAQNMIEHNVDYCLCYDGRVQQARKLNPDWEYKLDGALSVTAWIVQPKGSENQDMIDALLPYFLDPRRAAVFVESIGYSTANPEVEKFVPEDLKSYLSTSSSNFPKLVKLTPEQNVELAAQSEEVERAWTEWTGQ